MGFADLHIHTRRSDGTLTVPQVAARAARNGASLIAVSDHNQVESARELIKLASPALRVIPSVEFCSLFMGNDHHVLALGADLYDRRLTEAVRYSRRMLDRMSEVLVERLAEDHPGIRLCDYLAYPEGREEGGWKFLRYAVEKGLAADGREALGLYGRYDVTYADADFLPIGQVIDVIHEAGGRAVLAHPGNYGTTEECQNQVKEAFRLGADGCECYYPKHSAEMTEMLVGLCRAEKKNITAGSDCHGAFFGSSGDICETKTDESLLDLTGIRICG